MHESSIIHDMTKGNVFKQLITFSVPFMLANVLQIFYNIVDMIIVGQFIGSQGLSAVSIGADLVHLQLLICMGFSSAGQIVVSQYVGQKNEAGLSRFIGTLFSSLFIMGIIMTIAALLAESSLLNLLNTPAEALQDAKRYCNICFAGAIFSYGYNVIASILRGMGDSGRPLLFVAIASVINLVLDLLFVGVFRLGTAGAALATIIGQAVSLIISIVYLYRHRVQFCFDFHPKSFQIDYSSLVMLFKLGLPLALQSAAISTSQLFVSSNINSYGLVVSAVNGIGGKIGQTGVVVTSAVSSAGSSMIGQNLAARKRDRITKVVYHSLGISLIYCGLLSLIIAIFPEQVFSLFNSEPEILAMSHTYVIIAVLNFMGFALRNPMMGLINGLGCAKLAMFIGIMDGIVSRVCLALLLGEVLNMGIMGYWLGNVFAGYMPFIIGGVFFFSGLWKRIEPVVPADFSTN